MRILHVVVRSQRRGAELVAIELAAELDRLGHANQIVALGLGQDGGVDPALPPLSRRVRLSPDVVVSGAWRVRRLLRRQSFDVVLAHGGMAAEVAAIAAARRGPAVVWQRILGFPDVIWRPSRRWWWWAVTRRIDAAVALTADLATEMDRLHFTGPVEVIPNFRRPERFVSRVRSEDAARLRGDVGAGPEVHLVGFVGHLVDQKRPLRAVEVLDRLRDGGLDAHLVVCGGGPLAGAVADDIRRRGLAEHATLLGHRDDVERILAGIDLLLLTSDAEGIPGVAIEAQMAGCPVVTFRVGAVGDVVEDGVSGIVLPGSEADVEAVSAAASALLRDRDRLDAMSTAARARVEEFSAPRFAVAYDELFASLVGGAESAPRRPGSGSFSH